MSIFKITLISIFLAIISTHACALESNLVPTDLRCENLKIPLGIDVVKPRLSWNFEPAVAAHGRA